MNRALPRDHDITTIRGFGVPTTSLLPRYYTVAVPSSAFAIARPCPHKPSAGHHAHSRRHLEYVRRSVLFKRHRSRTKQRAIRVALRVVDVTGALLKHGRKETWLT